MKVKISPSLIDGKLTAPSSNSYTQSAMACALFAKGSSVIKNVTWTNEAITALSIVQNFGADVNIVNNCLKAEGGKPIYSDQINCGESGSCFDMFSPVAALQDKPITVNASDNILKQHAIFIEKKLRKAGVMCTTNNGNNTVIIHGPIKGGHLKPGLPYNSHFVTGLLISLPLLSDDSVIELESPAGKHDIDITLNVMQKFGVYVDNNSYLRFTISGKQCYKPAEIDIEGDWNSACFLLTGAAIAGKMKIKNLHSDSYQPDKAITSVLEKAGARVKSVSDTVICKHNMLKSFVFDATQYPGLVYPLVALAARCNGKSILSVRQNITDNENNNLDILIREYLKMGVNIYMEKETLIIEPGVLKPVEINPENDHRIAMAAAVTYLGTNKTVTINKAECVNKSYPGFWEELKCMGVHAEIINE